MSECGEMKQRQICCETCKYLPLDMDEGPCEKCFDEYEFGNYQPNRSIILPYLNGLTPTLESCKAKVYEEIGELMQCLGKHRRMSGENTPEMDRREWAYNTISEALDGAQSLVTLINTLAEEYEIDVQEEVGRHVSKMARKGYLVNGGNSDGANRNA